jgi:hypothetical protein
MNYELERMWKEEAVAWIRVLSQHLPGGNEKTTKILSQDSQSMGQDLNAGLPEYKIGVLTL